MCAADIERYFHIYPTAYDDNSMGESLGCIRNAVLVTRHVPIIQVHLVQSITVGSLKYMVFLIHT